MTDNASRTSGSVLRVPVAAVVLGPVSAAMWFVWLSWDHSYYDVDGVAQGPYRPWQVVGCALAVAVACVLVRRTATHWLGLLLLPAAGAIGFSVPWSADAAASDSTGLWGVGLLMLLVGGALGLLVVLAVTDSLLEQWHGRRVPR